jgi:hypothetical protein
MSHVKTDKLSARTASGTITLGESGETLTIPSGVVLTNNGTASGFGKVLQVVSSTKTTAQTISTTSFTAITNLDVSITPSSTSSKILIIAEVSAYRFGAIRLYRNGSSLGITSGISNDNNSSLLYLDSPATTSSTTYQVYGRHYNSSYAFIINDNSTYSYGEIASTITAIEVAG